MRERDVHEEQTPNVCVLRIRNKGDLYWCWLPCLAHLPLRLSDCNLLIKKEANSLIWIIGMFKRQQKLRKVCHSDTMLCQSIGFVRCMLGMIPFQLRLEMNSLTWFRPLCHQNIHAE